jgi:hypothetical protein
MLLNAKSGSIFSLHQNLSLVNVFKMEFMRVLDKTVGL